MKENHMKRNHVRKKTVVAKIMKG